MATAVATHRRAGRSRPQQPPRQRERGRISEREAREKGEGGKCNGRPAGDGHGDAGVRPGHGRDPGEKHAKEQRERGSGRTRERGRFVTGRLPAAGSSGRRPPQQAEIAAERVLSMKLRWMFSPPKLLLISKSIFCRLMLYVKLGLAKFVRNVEK